MGGEAPAGPRTLRAQVPRDASLRLLRDGAEIAAVEGRVLEQRVEEPGVYRVEALRRRHGRERTWIMSNPIYLRGTRTTSASESSGRSKRALTA
jgi:hypothetical protein